MNLDTFEKHGHAHLDPNDRRLGAILLRRGWITPAQLDEGLDSQIVNGGRIGTNLLELNHLSEDQLAKALEEQHQVAAAHGEILPHEDALAVIRAELCDRHDLIPLRVEKHADGESLYLGVVSPMPAAHLEELGRRLKMLVHQMVVPEFRMNQLLRKYAKAHRPVRQVDLTHAAKLLEAKEKAAQQEEKSEELMSEEEFQSLYANAISGGRHDNLAELHDEHHETLHESKDDHPPLHPELAGKKQVHIDVSHHDDPEHEVNAYHPEPAAPLQRAKAPPPPSASAETVPPLSFADAQIELARSQNRDEIAHTVMRYTAGKYLRSVIFSIHGDHLTGWEGVGRGLEGHAARKVGIAMSNAHFRQVCLSGKPFIGALQQDATVAAFFKLMGGAPATSILVPVQVRGRTVNVIYADGGPGRPSNTEIVELGALAAQVGRAYEAILLQRKTKAA